MTNNDHKYKLHSLGHLDTIADTPIGNLAGFIKSAFTPEGDLDTNYTAKYKEAYSALIETANFTTVYSRIGKEAVDLCDISQLKDLKRLLKEAGFTPLEADLSSLIADMTFQPHALPKHIEEDEPEIEITEADEYNVSQYTDLILKAYDSLYSTVYDAFRPEGAYSPDKTLGEYGAIKHHTDEGNDSTRTPTKAGMDRIAALYEALLGSATVTESNNLTAAELGARAGYYFSWAAGRFASGSVKSTDKRFKERKDFEAALSEHVKKKLVAVYKAYAKDGRDAQQEALRNAASNLAAGFIVAEFDPVVSNLLVLKVCAPGVPIVDDPKQLQAVIDSKNFGSVQVRGVHKAYGEATDFPVYTVTVALNSKLEREAPMYAYQAWDEIAKNGVIRELVGTHNVIFGRRNDGSLHSFNMAKLGGNPDHNVAVVAASRSGKGLTTLATLAAAAAHGEPIFYLDCKPDMASMLEKYMESVGKPGRLFSYDALGGAGKRRTPIKGSDAARYKHYEFPHNFRGIAGVQGFEPLFGGYIFAKATTLMLAMMRFSNQNSPERLDALGYDLNKGALLVWDELEKTELQRWSALLDLCATTKLTNEKEGSGKDARLTDRAKYVIKLQALVDELATEIATADKAILGFTPISTLSLFQTTKYVTGGNAKLQGIFGTNSLVGRIDEKNATKAILDGRSDETVRALSARQWYATGSVKSLDTTQLTQPIKPFLVFNYPKDVDRYINEDAAYLKLPRSYREKVERNKHKMDFVGLLKAYDIDLSASLALGYDMAQRFLQLAGFKGTVDDFVLSAQEETLISVSELCERAIAGYEGKTVVGSPSYDEIPEEMGGDITDDFDEASPVTQANEAYPLNQQQAEVEESLGKNVVREKAHLDGEKAMFPLAMQVIDAALPLFVRAGYSHTQSDEDNQDNYGYQDSSCMVSFNSPTGRLVNVSFRLDDWEAWSSEYDLDFTANRRRAECNSLATKHTPEAMAQAMLSAALEANKRFEEMFGSPASTPTAPSQNATPFYQANPFQQAQPQHPKGFVTAPDGRRYFDAGGGSLVPIYTTPDGKSFFADANGNLIPADGRFAITPNISPGVFGNQRMTPTPVTDSGMSQRRLSDSGAWELSDPAAMVYAQPLDRQPIASYKGRLRDIDHTMSDRALESSLAQRWHILMAAGASVVGGSSLVTLVHIGEHTFKVNDKEVFATESILGASNIRISDLVDFPALFKQYKNVKWLSLDPLASIAFSTAYSKAALAFTASKTLQMIRFIGANGQYKDYSRRDAAAGLGIPQEQLNSRFNSWTAMAAKVNKGTSSALCKPGNRLLMADWTKRMAAGAFGTKSTWSKKRKFFGFFGMLLAGAGTVVTGGIQAGRAAIR